MKRFIIFPILIAIHPILAVFAASGKWQPIEDYFRFGMFSLAIVLFLWVVLATLLNDAVRSAIAISVSWFLLFAYGSVMRKLGPLDFTITCTILVGCALLPAIGLSTKSKSRWLWMMGIVAVFAAFAFLAKPLLTEGQIYATLWLGVTILSACFVGSTQMESLVPYLNIAAVGLIALPGYQMYEICRDGAEHNKSLNAPTLQFGKKTTSPRPDIYHFVLDGYGRADVLNRDFGYDNKPFLNALQARGFFVASKSTANYAQTEKSLATELNGNYLDKLATHIDLKTKNRSLFVNLIRDNAVSRVVRDRGYDYITISTGFSPFNRDSSREDLSDPSGLSLAEQLMLYQTPEAGFGFSSQTLTQIHRDRVEHAFDSAVTAPRNGKPRYVLIHILSPHPPFVFDRNGKAVDPKHLYGIWDADMFVEAIASRAEYTTGYPAQLEYINKRLLETIDEIKKNSKTPPVFILQGDHGPRRDHSMKSYDDTKFGHSYPNLVAVAGPPAVKKNMYDRISNVNILRAVLAGLFGSKFEKLPDRNYYSTWAQPYENTEITSKVN